MISAIFGAGLLFAAAHERTPVMPREPHILVATELLEQSSRVALLDCSAEVPLARLELLFERITRDPDPVEMRHLLGRGTSRQVDFTWDPDSGQLTYAAPSTLTPPANSGAVPSPQVLANCESR